MQLESKVQRHGKERKRKGIWESFCSILNDSLDFIKILSIVEQADEYMYIVSSSSSSR